MSWIITRWPARPVVNSETLLALVLVYFIAVCNNAFWRALLDGRDWRSGASWGLTAAMLIGAVGLHFAIVALFVTRRTTKPLLIVLSVATAVATVFMQTYTVYLDPTMMRNALRTDWAETRELLSIGSLLRMMLYALPPIALTLWVRLREHSLRYAIALRSGAVTFAAIASGAALVSIMQDIAPLFRTQREVRYLLTPGNFIYSSWRNVSRSMSVTPIERVHARSRQEKHTFNDISPKPTLFIIVIGETARGANFSLNGYPRKTNPQLENLGVVSFTDVTSCGTATEVSLPCMFSSFGRQTYDSDEHRNYDGLLQALAHSGTSVVWRDNQSGCKGVCEGDGIVFQDTRDWAPADKCTEGRCLDEVLLDGLTQLMRTPTGDLVIVLHQLGNHGPAYFRRYPPPFRRFLPTCDTTELRKCTREEIVNAYDNAILYTDDLLAKTIRFLQSQASQYDTAMLYVADHGESLGERGLYLHGLPYAIAPRDQTHVPMIWWSSKEFQHDAQLNMDCVRERAKAPASHDNFYHSVLGLLSVDTTAYVKDRDLFAACRQPTEDRLGLPVRSPMSRLRQGASL